jgi:hypothetical protein
MCIVLILCYSLRTGQYIRFELWYFIALYFCLKRHDVVMGSTATPRREERPNPAIG